MGADVLTINVTREEVRGGDGHNGSRNQCANRDGGKGKAREPRGEHLVDEGGYRAIGAVGGWQVNFRGNRHVAQQGQQAEHERVDWEEGGIALDDLATVATQSTGERVR